MARKPKPRPNPCKFIVLLALLAVFLALPVAAQAKGTYGTTGENGTSDTGGATIGADEIQTRTWPFNATTATNSTGVTATFPFFEWATQCKMWAKPNPTYNSTGAEQAWTTPALGTLVIGDSSRNMASNQTVSGSISLASPGSVIVDGPAKSWTFEPRNVADNRTVTVEGYCWR